MRILDSEIKKIDNKIGRRAMINLDHVRKSNISFITEHKSGFFQYNDVILYGNLKKDFNTFYIYGNREMEEFDDGIWKIEINDDIECLLVLWTMHTDHLVWMNNRCYGFIRFGLVVSLSDKKYVNKALKLNLINDKRKIQRQINNILHYQKMTTRQLLNYYTINHSSSNPIDIRNELQLRGYDTDYIKTRISELIKNIITEKEQVRDKIKKCLIKKINYPFYITQSHDDDHTLCINVFNVPPSRIYDIEGIIFDINEEEIKNYDIILLPMIRDIKDTERYYSNSVKKLTGGA